MPYPPDCKSFASQKDSCFLNQDVHPFFYLLVNFKAKNMLMPFYNEIYIKQVGSQTDNLTLK